MSSQLRKFKRNKQKQFHYNMYLRQKKIIDLKNRRKRALAELEEVWTGAVKEFVPKWVRAIAYNVPPVWYLKKVNWLMENVIYGTKWYEKFKEESKMWPGWRYKFNLYATNFIRKIAGMILLKWMLHLRGRLLIGISQKIYEEDGYLKIVVKYWFRTVREKSVKI